MEAETDGEPKRIVRSPGFDGSRPISLRHLSSDLVSYIDMYGAKPGDHDNTLGDGSGEGTDFLSTTNVAVELENLRNLRRLSMSDSKIDPDVPTQSYEVASSIDARNAGVDDVSGDSSFWVPARIHPELAPQEWQSFVQKKNGVVDPDMFTGPLRTPSIKRGLSRSKSLLSREVSERAAEQYIDAGPELERRRSRLRPQLVVKNLGTLIDNDAERGRNLVVARSPSGSSHGKESSNEFDSDEPILIPPPGQILRRAARTGKAKGSYRKLGRAKTPDLSISDSTQSNSQPIRPDGTQYFEAEEIQLRDDAPRDSEAKPAVLTSEVIEPQVERTKSRNRTIQVVGPRSSPSVEEEQSSTGETKVLNDLPSQEQGIGKAEMDIGRSNHSRTSVLTSTEGQTVQTGIPSEMIIVNQPQSASMKSQTHVGSSGQPENDELTKGVALSVLHDESVTPGSSLVEHSHGDVPIHPGSITSAAKQARPALKRELSAASLTRAVMNGTAPAPLKTSPPRKTPSENTENELVHVKSNTSSINSAPSKKSAWGKLFSSDEKDRTKVKKDSKVGSKMKRTASQEESLNSEKDSVSTNLFSSIFGGGRKKEKDTSEPVKREGIPTTKPSNREPHFYSRYPIQLERAIYRMAHLKLGNSRRPLAHQVLLSNFMYGYLALVGANASGQSQGPSAHASRSRAPAGAQRANHRRGGETGEQQQRRSSPVRNKSPNSTQRAPLSKREDGPGSTSPTMDSYVPSSHSPAQSPGTTNNHESIAG